jgi:hypothetical protein
VKKKKTLQLILKVISVLTISGGAVRLIAGRNTFDSFLIGALWSYHPYFIYIYRVLGAFVIFAGFMLFMLANSPGRYRYLIGACGFCFSFIACVMLLSGLLLKMELLHYICDFVFCVIIAWVCFALHKQNTGSLTDGE